MRKLAFYLSFAVLTVSAPAGEIRAQQDSQEIAIGVKLSLISEVLGEERAYWVHLPASYGDDRYAPQRYPVLYLLDGDAHFHSASGVVQFMSAGINGNIQIPEMIVVAIPNTNRTRDLTPTRTTVGYDGSETSAFSISGGGDNFLEFIRDELFPKIESTYRTKPYRVLVGHSFGGLSALHALMVAPEMFQAHIAIDPSVWWDDRALVREAERYFAEPGERKGSVYISLANNSGPESDEPSPMREAGMAFGRSLESAATSTFRTEVRYFEAEDHGSVPLLSLYHGLLHTFEGYKPSRRLSLDDPSTLRLHFDRISERLGVVLFPPEAWVNRLAFTALRQDLDSAIELFKINAANFPDSYNAYESLGAGYEAKQETALAVESYQRSLELNPANENAKKRLRALGR